MSDDTFDGIAGQPTYELFVCYASEDNERFVEPLVSALVALEVSVWYDRFAIRPGDDFVQKMDEGLRASLLGVVVLSPRSRTYWTERELGALFAKEAATQPRGAPSRIVPIRCDLTIAEIAARSPLLAGRHSIAWDDGIDGVARRIADLVRGAKPTLRARSPLYNVPRGSRTFVGREDELAELEARLAPGRSVTVAPAASLEGLAGIGKSELATQAAHRLARTDRFPGGIFWLEAERSELTPQWGGAIADALAVPAGPELERSQAVLRIIANAGPALLVLDNVTAWHGDGEPEPLPNGPNVALLITTRERNLGGAAFDHVGVDRLAPDAARTLLTTLARGADAGRDHSREPGLDDLLTHLDGHALALELAGAYLCEVPGVTPAAYLVRLRSGAAVEATVSDRTRYERTVAQAFDATILRLDEPSLAALRTCAQFADDPASLVLLRACGITDDAITLLRRFHLISISADRWTMHRLVREYSRNDGTTDDQTAARRRFVLGLGRRAHVDVARGASMEQRLSIYSRDRKRSHVFDSDWSHLVHGLELAQTLLAGEPAALAGLLNEIGLAMLADKIYLATRLLAVAWAVECGVELENFDDEEPPYSIYTLTSRLLAQDELAERLPSLGEDHPDVINLERLLAMIFADLGDPARACTLVEQVLASHVRLLGEHAAEVGFDLCFLAIQRSRTGDHRSALELLDRARVVADLHPAGSGLRGCHDEARATVEARLEAAREPSMMRPPRPARGRRRRRH